MAAMHSRGDALMYATEASQAGDFFGFRFRVVKKMLQFGAWGDFYSKSRQAQERVATKHLIKRNVEDVTIQNCKKAAVVFWLLKKGERWHLECFSWHLLSKQTCFCFKGFLTGAPYQSNS